MNFLNVFEQRVGGLFGATAQGLTAPFSFKKLAKKAAREMEAETFVIDGVDTAPALYTILVSTEDDLAMRPLYAQLTNETAQFIEGQAQNKGYVFVGHPLVRFMADPSLKSGRFSVFAENVDVQTLARLREEEAKFMGADPSFDAGLGGAASQQMARGVTPQTAQPAMRISASLSPTPMGGMDAGLDVLPQETVLDAEEAALGAAARRNQNVPLVGSRQAGSPAPQPFVPQPVQQPVFGAQPAGAAVQPVAVAPQPVMPQAAAAHHVAARHAAPMQVPTPAVGFGQDVATEVAGAAASYAGAHVAPVATAMGTEPVAPEPQPGTPQTVRARQAVPAPQAAPVTCLLIDRQSGRTYTVSAPRTIIGRERTPGGVVLHDPNVSRSHAELSFDGQGWRIRDLNSTNGTLVNDVDVDECPLRDGDLITLGLVNLEFREN